MLACIHGLYPSRLPVAVDNRHMQVAPLNTSAALNRNRKQTSVSRPGLACAALATVHVRQLRRHLRSCTRPGRPARQLPARACAGSTACDLWLPPAACQFQTPTTVMPNEMLALSQHTATFESSGAKQTVRHLQAAALEVQHHGAVHPITGQRVTVFTCGSHQRA